MKKLFFMLAIVSSFAISANAQTRTRSSSTTADSATRAKSASGTTRATQTSTGTTGRAGASSVRATPTTSQPSTTTRAAVGRRAGIGSANAGLKITATTPTTTATTTETASISTEDKDKITTLKSILNIEDEKTLTPQELTAKFEAAMESAELKLSIQSQCQEKFAECMDMVCKDSTYERCVCGSGYAELEPIQTEIATLTTETNALLQEELARAKMTDKEREFYENQKIALNLDSTKKTESDSDYGSITVESLMAGYYTGTDSSSSTMKTGSALFKEAQKACKPILDACPAESKAIVAYYNNLTSKDCQTAKNALNEQKSATKFARQKAEFTVKKAAYDTVSAKLDNATCFIELQELILSDALCGKDYKTCLNCNENFTTSSYTLALSNPTDTTDTTSIFSKKYTGCTATNIKTMIAKKEVFNTVLNKCQAPLVAWNTFMIDFAGLMEKAAKDQLFAYNTETREKEFNVADQCQKDIDKCLKDICGTSYISCTSREKAVNYNLALIDETNALVACNTVKERCNSRVEDAGASAIDVESIWAAAWKRTQNQGDITYQTRLSALIKETADVTKAELKMETELAEETKRSQNVINRLDSVLAAENTLSDAKLNSQIAKAEGEEAKNKIATAKAKQIASEAGDIAAAQRGCEKEAGVWESGNCYWEITASGETYERNWKRNIKDETRKTVSKTDKIATGAKFSCVKPSEWQGFTGCSWAKGKIGEGGSITLPTLNDLVDTAGVTDTGTSDLK